MSHQIKKEVEGDGSVTEEPYETILGLAKSAVLEKYKASFTDFELEVLSVPGSVRGEFTVEVEFVGAMENVHSLYVEDNHQVRVKHIRSDGTVDLGVTLYK